MVAVPTSVIEALVVVVRRMVALAAEVYVLIADVDRVSAQMLMPDAIVVVGHLKMSLIMGLIIVISTVGPWRNQVSRMVLTGRLVARSVMMPLPSVRSRLQVVAQTRMVSNLR